MARVQPLGAQLALRFGPRRAKRPHVFGGHASGGLANGIHVPGQIGGVGAAAGAGHGRVHDHQACQALRLLAGGTNGDAATHGVADQCIALQPQRLGKGRYIGRLRVQAVVQVGPGCR
ncbi:hypothetical protein G6F35_015653 [Rhizopus arrhizus]|nr:hypothetical protein G6F35_015653 [Rhizopus arrhizus]